mmetsp:Transcript_42090/g.99221  ORF Transcript_42090/g.99221 Transcript_42090/m.99221 type:complete len:266 (+) Transcript_42090:48-845(+)
MHGPFTPPRCDPRRLARLGAHQLPLQLQLFHTHCSLAQQRDTEFLAGGEDAADPDRNAHVLHDAHAHPHRPQDRPVLDTVAEVASKDDAPADVRRPEEVQVLGVEEDSFDRDRHAVREDAHREERGLFAHRGLDLRVRRKHLGKDVRRDHAQRDLQNADADRDRQHLLHQLDHLSRRLLVDGATFSFRARLVLLQLRQKRLCSLEDGLARDCEEEEHVDQHLVCSERDEAARPRRRRHDVPREPAAAGDEEEGSGELRELDALLL